MKSKKTKQLMSVFFVIATLSLIGAIWQFQDKFISTIKTQGGSFKEGIIGTPRFINPVLAQSQSDKDMTKLLFSSLIEQDEFGKNIFKLAESLEISEDKKSYILGLKKNLFFHDKKKITTDDLIFTIEKIQDPLIKSPLFNKWEGIKVEKLDSYTVKFSLSQEYSDFQNNLMIGILPKHLWDNIKSEEFIFNMLNSKPIGSGNYEIEKIDYKKSGVPKSYILKKTDRSLAYISEIKLFFYENENELANAFRSNEINSAYGLSANKQNRDLFDNEFEITGKLPRIFGLFFNQNKQLLLKDKNIRELISSAINKQELIDEVFTGYAYPINSPLANLIDRQNKEIKEYQKNIEKDGWSKNENGIYQKGSGDDVDILSIDLSTPNIAELTATSNFIKKSLKDYGIEINIRTFDEGNLHQKVIRPRDYEILLFGYMIEKNTDLYAFWHSSQKNDPGLNISLYSNSNVDKELEKLRKDKSNADLSIIEEEIVRDLPAIFLYSPAYTYILPKKIKGEVISITEKQDRFSNIEEWYIKTRKVWNIFVK